EVDYKIDADHAAEKDRHPAGVVFQGGTDHDDQAQPKGQDPYIDEVEQKALGHQAHVPARCDLGMQLSLGSGLLLFGKEIDSIDQEDHPPEDKESGLVAEVFQELEAAEIGDDQKTDVREDHP